MFVFFFYVHVVPRDLLLLTLSCPPRRSSYHRADASDPRRRLRRRFSGRLADDRFGDVVVAAPVGGALGQAELVEMAGAPRGMPGGAFVDLRGVVDEVAVAAKRLHVGDLADRKSTRLNSSH